MRHELEDLKSKNISKKIWRDGNKKMDILLGEPLLYLTRFGKLRWREFIVKPTILVLQPCREQGGRIWLRAPVLNVRATVATVLQEGGFWNSKPREREREKERGGDENNGN